MKIKTLISVEPTDICDINRVFEAGNLVGISECSEEVQKVFGRIRANEFTFDDAEAAINAIYDRGFAVVSQSGATMKYLSPDPKTQETWYRGVISNTLLAMRMINEFFESLLSGLPLPLGNQIEMRGHKLLYQRGQDYRQLELQLKYNLTPLPVTQTDSFHKI